MMAAMGAALIILRHGEKPAKAKKNGSLELSPKGKARAVHRPDLSRPRRRQAVLRQERPACLLRRHAASPMRGSELQTTLWKLLNLDRVGAPDTWPDDDYDTIGRIECGASGKPRKFRALPQGFRPRRKRAA